MDARTKLLVSGRGSYAGALPTRYPDGSVCIPKSQVKLHKNTELLAIVFGAPLMIWTATRDRPLGKAEKVGLLALAGGTLIVDTMLRSRFNRAKKAKPGQQP